MQTHCVSADNGSSIIKAMGDHGRARFPAVAHPLPSSGPPVSGEIAVGGRRYLLGDYALLYQAKPTAEPHRERDYHGGDMQAVLVCGALRELRVSGDVELLVTSLPYRYSRMESLLSAVRARHTFAWDGQDGPKTVRFGQVKVMPQGVGALMGHDRDNPDIAEGTVAILLDLGSSTADLVVLRRKGGGWRYVEEACSSWHDMGSVAGFYTSWAASLRAEPGLATYPFHYHGLMERAQHGRFKLPHMGGEVDLQPSFEALARSYQGDILQRLRLECGEALWAEAAQIVVTGGGAEIASYFPWPDPRILKLDTWANAEGQHHYYQQRRTS